VCSFDFNKIQNKILLCPLPNQIIHQSKQINLFLVFYRHVVKHIVYYLLVIKLEMSKKRNRSTNLRSVTISTSITGVTAIFRITLLRWFHHQSNLCGQSCILRLVVRLYLNEVSIIIIHI